MNTLTKEGGEIMKLGRVLTTKAGYVKDDIFIRDDFSCWANDDQRF